VCEATEKEKEVEEWEMGLRDRPMPEPLHALTPAPAPAAGEEAAVEAAKERPCSALATTEMEERMVRVAASTITEGSLNTIVSI
jgi:hypothetical protein